MMHPKTEDQLEEGAFKQAQIEIQDWAEKYNKYKGTNADDLRMDIYRLC